MKCPICKKEVPSESLFMPFCSDRCRIVDLGNWSSGTYVISTPITDLEELRLTESDDEAD